MHINCTSIRIGTYSNAPHNSCLGLRYHLCLLPSYIPQNALFWFDLCFCLFLISFLCIKTGWRFIGLFLWGGELIWSPFPSFQEYSSVNKHFSQIFENPVHQICGQVRFCLILLSNFSSFLVCLPPTHTHTNPNLAKGYLCSARASQYLRKNSLSVSAKSELRQKICLLACCKSKADSVTSPCASLR